MSDDIANATLTKVWVHGGTGSDGNPGTEAEPFKTFEKALNQIGPNGGTIMLEGEIPDPYRVMNRYYVNALYIDGQGKTIFKNPASCQDSRNVITKRSLFISGLNFNNSKLSTEECLADITFDDCIFKYGRIFAGGYCYRDITLKGCTVEEVISPTSTHAIYFSGGHWDKGAHLPGPSNINIIGCTIRYAGGRHGIQFNGRFKNCRVKYSNIYATAIAAVQGIGVDGFDIRGNNFFVNNGGPLRCFDDMDQWPWDPNDLEDIKNWKLTHHPNRNWFIRNNMFFVGPKSWCNWYNPSQPKNRPCILFNNEVHGSSFPNGEVADYAPQNHVIADNVLVSPWSNIVEFHEVYTPWVTTVRDNLIYTYEEGGQPLVTFNHDVPVHPKAYTIKDLESWPVTGKLYGGNILDVDPEFGKIPEYPDASEIPPPPNYDWSKHPMAFDFWSEVAAKLKKGPPKDYVWTPGRLVKANKRQRSGPRLSDRINTAFWAEEPMS